MNHRYFMAAYTASPSPHDWNADLEKRYFQALATQPNIIGIEQPFYIDSHKYPLTWLRDTVPDHWSIIITTLPAFMGMARSNPYLGLASKREQDRSLAVKVMEQVSDSVCQLNQAFGKNIVRAVHFHALPKNDDVEARGHKELLIKSLSDIKNFDWQGASLNLEHCDAYIPGQAAEKGFLLLQDELEALNDVGGFGLVLNWARSAIEGRSIDTPISHIKMAKAANLLKGFFFSGCSDDPQSDYGYWKDTHMPPRNVGISEYLPGNSLLDRDEIQQVFSLLDEAMYLGVKVTDSSKQKSLERSVGLCVDTIEVLGCADA